MPEFRYRLQVLLDQKEELKQQAAEELAAAQRLVREAEQRLEELREGRREQQARKDRLRKELLAGGELSGVEIQRRVAGVRAAAQAVEDAANAVFSQEIVLEECQERAAEARRTLAERTREVEVLNKHREKCQRRFVQERERKEAQEDDEIGAAMWAGRQKAEARSQEPGGRS